jgi:hypothetical protein
MRRFFSIAILCISAFILLFSCNKDNSQEKLRKIELEKLDEFINIHYKDSIPKPSGLYYIEEVKGTGDSIVPGDRVQIFYSYWTNGGTDSMLVEETYGFMEGFRLEPEEFQVLPANLLSSESATSILQTPGLHEAITYMQQGTVANLVLPSEIAFGTGGYYIIGGFTTILMRLEVHKIYRANQ